MIGLFFEVMPREGHTTSYFELAAVLKPELERSGGVLFVDRYTSADRPEVRARGERGGPSASFSSTSDRKALFSTAPPCPTTPIAMSPRP